MVDADDPFYLKFWAKVTPVQQKRLFSIDIVRHASAVTPSKKRSINTY